MGVEHNVYGAYWTWGITSIVHNGMGRNGYGHYRLGVKWPWVNTGRDNMGKGNLGMVQWDHEELINDNTIGIW